MKEINGQKLTKADLIKKIEAVEEHSLWEQIVGINYNYIVEHFLEIKNYRNDVMHNHLLTYEQYVCEQSILNHAIEELDRVINDKLLVNDSTYSNSTNIMEVLGGMIVLVSAAAAALNKFAHSETGQNLIKGLECQTAHCGRCKLHFVFGEFTSPIVPYRNLPQAPDGMTADCCSLV